jgi:hypothetical protein
MAGENIQNFIHHPVRTISIVERKHGDSERSENRPLNPGIHDEYHNEGFVASSPV